MLSPSWRVIVEAPWSLDRGAPRTLVVRRLLFHMIDHQHRLGPLLRFQLQAELFRQGIRKRKPAAGVGRHVGAAGTSRRAISFAAFAALKLAGAAEVKREVEIAFESRGVYDVVANIPG